MDENTKINIPNLGYKDLNDLAHALTNATSGYLMSLEEARFIWKKHIIKIGWKQNKLQPTISETKKVVPKIKTEKKKPNKKK